MTIVIVDDDKEDVDMLCDAVGEIDKSITCISFSCGPDLVQYLKVADPIPEYIFIDLVMPDMSGTECFHEVRKNSKFRDTNLVIYSGLMYHNQFESFRNQNTTILFKPTSYQILVDEVRAMLKKE